MAIPKLLILSVIVVAASLAISSPPTLATSRNLEGFFPPLPQFHFPFGRSWNGTVFSFPFGFHFPFSGSSRSGNATSSRLGFRFPFSGSSLNGSASGFHFPSLPFFHFPATARNSVTDKTPPQSTATPAEAPPQNAVSPAGKETPAEAPPQNTGAAPSPQYTSPAPGPAYK